MSLTALLKEHFNVEQVEPLWPGSSTQVFSVAGADAVATWKTLQALTPQSKHWPVLLGPAEHREGLAENYQDRPDQRAVAEIIDAGIAFDLDAWRAKQPAIDEEDDMYGEEFAEEFGADIAEMIDAAPEDDPDADPPFSIPRNVLTRAYHPQVLVGLCPTIHGWHVPAHLSFGGWNACPPPEVHVALYRHWAEKHGAQLLGMTHDIVEFYVPQPPTSEDEVDKLAREHFWLCDDIVFQGVGSFPRLKKTLNGARSWYFWWD